MVVDLVRAREDAEGILWPMLHFFERVCHARGDDFVAVGAAPSEALSEFFLVWWHDEDVYQRVLDDRIFAFADLSGALHIDIHHHIDAFFYFVDDFRKQRPVEISMDFSVLEELACRDLSFKLGDTEEEVIFAIFLARTRCSRGAGDSVACFAFV